MRYVLATTIAGISFLMAVSSYATAEFRILAPAEESFIRTSEILIIGEVTGDSEAMRVEVSDNGKIVDYAPLHGKVFASSFGVVDGRHEITLAARDVQVKTIKIFVGKQEGYRYHVKPDKNSCTDCHLRTNNPGFKVQSMQNEVCGQCHDAVDRKKFVHGPVAGGSCTPCHDPHGSGHDSFLVAVGRELCLTCHSQNFSKMHVEDRKNADCLKCHDPHSSGKEYQLR